MQISFLKMLCCPYAVTKCGVATGCPAFMGGLSPKLYRPAMQKRHKHWRQQHIGAYQDFRFLPNFSSQNLCWKASYQKMVKAKSNHHHCPISVFPLRPQYRGRQWDPLLGLWSVPMRKWCGGGRRASVLITSRWRGATSKHASHILYTLNPPSVSIPSDLSLAFLLAACETLLR